MSSEHLQNLLTEIRTCQTCVATLPLGPRPVLRASPTAKLLIIGQAPGTKVHQTGIPWNDPSGNQLRAWLKIGPDVFYDTQQIAIVPMGFCYPGKGKSGDLPPRKECAQQWHAPLLNAMPNIQLTLLIGQYAQRYYLDDHYKTLTERVRHWASCPAGVFPLPHPSPRNRLWLKKNPWFEQEVIPELRQRVSAIILNN